MEKVEDWKSRNVVEAVLIWTGWGSDIAPRRDDSLLIARFGAKVASDLLPMIKSMVDEFYTSDAKYTAADVAEMERMVVEDFRKKHPDVPDEIVKALAWCYTFDFR